MAFCLDRPNPGIWKAQPITSKPQKHQLLNPTLGLPDSFLIAGYAQLIEGVRDGMLQSSWNFNLGVPGHRV